MAIVYAEGFEFSTGQWMTTDQVEKRRAAKRARAQQAVHESIVCHEDVEPMEDKREEPLSSRRS